jgi:hypothetical protein
MNKYFASFCFYSNSVLKYGNTVFESTKGINSPEDITAAQDHIKEKIISEGDSGLSLNNIIILYFKEI